MGIFSHLIWAIGAKNIDYGEGNIRESICGDFSKSVNEVVILKLMFTKVPISSKDIPITQCNDIVSQQHSP